jgi:hypothetical protein
MKKHFLKGLSMQIIPFSEIEPLSISERVKKLLALVVAQKIVIIQGRLRPEEEARLIEDTMAMVDHIKNFKGMELAVIEPDVRDKDLFTKLRYGLVKRLGVSNALTIIGPCSLVREIKRDPRKIELLLT